MKQKSERSLIIQFSISHSNVQINGTSPVQYQLGFRGFTLEILYD